MVHHSPTIAAGLECTESSVLASIVSPQPHRLHPLEDEELRDEIELLLDVIVTVAGYPNHLSPEQVDAALCLSSADTSSSSSPAASAFLAEENVVIPVDEAGPRAVSLRGPRPGSLESLDPSFGMCGRSFA